MPWDGELGIFCNISNRGQRAAHEVVQLYVHDMVASRVRPVKELKGFQKIWLQAQETQTVRFRLKREQLAFATPPHSDSTMLYMVEPGKFLLWVAPSSAAGEPIEFHLAGPPRLSSAVLGTFLGRSHRWSVILYGSYGFHGVFFSQQIV